MNELTELKKQASLLILLRKYAYKKGEFTLSSGMTSQHYVNCKPLILTTVGLSLVCDEMLKHIDTVCVAGLTLGADPLVSGLVMKGKSGLIIRKEPKGHGTASQVEGPLPPIGTSITVVEDVTTTGGSSLKAVQVLRDLDYNVDRVVTIVDREDCAKERFLTEGVELKSLITLSELEL